MEREVVLCLNRQYVLQHKDHDAVLYSWAYSGDAPPPLIIWHWCEQSPGEPSWRGAVAARHSVIIERPLTLTPSIHFSECCDLHGTITNGKWDGN